MAGYAIVGVVGLVIVVLIAFLMLPELGSVLQNSIPTAPF